MNKERELLNLGKTIKKYRESKGLTQSQLALKIDKDRESISRLERGVVNPTYLYLKEVCSGLEISIEELMRVSSVEET